MFYSVMRTSWGYRVKGKILAKLLSEPGNSHPMLGYWIKQDSTKGGRDSLLKKLIGCFILCQHEYDFTIFNNVSKSFLRSKCQPCIYSFTL